MHYRHVLLIKAENEKDAECAAEKFLKYYGDGRVWDYYRLGGRWDWKGKNVKNINKYKKFCEKQIRQLLKTQDLRTKDYYKRIMNEMKNVGVTSFDEIDKIKHSMLCFYIKCYGVLLNQDYCEDSYFWDEEEGLPSISEDRLKKVLASRDYWLVNVDLHN